MIGTKNIAWPSVGIERFAIIAGLLKAEVIANDNKNVRTPYLTLKP